MFKVVEIPSSLGAPDIHCGMEYGPEALVGQLKSESIKIQIPQPQESERVKNVSAISILNKTIKQAVELLLDSGNSPLILMGDCSSSIGAVYALRNKHIDLGVIWFDTHGDFNTPEISPSGCLYGMGLAHIAGYGDKSILNLSGKYVSPRNILMIGQRNLDEKENLLINELGITICQNINEKIAACFKEFRDRGINDIYLHFDLDVIDKKFNPAVLTPTEGGLTPHKVLEIFNYLKDNFNIVGAGISNYIPSKDANGSFAEYILSLIMTITNL